MRAFAVLGLALALLASPAGAVQPDEVLPDPALERRARDISAELRCLVCQNQSIDDSDAPLAKDLRILVRDRLRAGDSDAAVREYVVQRYGEFVLLRPSFRAQTLLLWLAPVLVLATGGLGLFLARRRRTAEVPPLDAAEAESVQRLLSEDPGRR